MHVIISEILQIQSLDGFIFSLNSIQTLDQPHMEYLGYRVSINCMFEGMKDKIQVDIGVGDVVEPIDCNISFVKYRLKPIFESFVSLKVYPMETIFAEKLETIVSKGLSNSRMKDYHDLLLMIRSKKMINNIKLKDSLSKTFSNRNTGKLHEEKI